MGKVTSEISMSLDGFITGPNVGVGNGMGDDGDRLHDWRFDAKTETESACVGATRACSPARVASATFDFSHPSNLSVNHPASPVTEGLSHRDGERLMNLVWMSSDIVDPGFGRVWVGRWVPALVPGLAGGWTRQG
jgi:hypothetical protein